MTLYAIDIDQTICGSNAFEVYARFHNDDLNLQVDSATLQQLSSYRNFFFLPQVKAFRQANEREWNASRHRAIATPSVIEAFSPIQGAAEGISVLSQLGTVCYYTARTPVVRAATQRWLARYNFAQSQNVICCSSIDEKIRALSHHNPQDEPIVLIDDRGHTHFFAALDHLRKETIIQTLLQRLRIVAFGTSTLRLPETTLCSLFALPSWNDLQTIMPSVMPS